MGPHQTEKLLHSKGNQKENKKTTYRMGERKSFQHVVLGKLDRHMQIDETGTHPHTMHKNKPQVA